MLIKYKKPDPRAGMQANLEKTLAQKAIDEGRADEVKQGAAEPKAEAKAPAKKATKKASKKVR